MDVHTVFGVAAAVSPSVYSGCGDLYAHTVLGVAAVSPSVYSGCGDLYAHTVLGVAAVSPMQCLQWMWRPMHTQCLVYSCNITQCLYSGCGDLCTHNAWYIILSTLCMVQLWLSYLYPVTIGFINAPYFVSENGSFVDVTVGVLSGGLQTQVSVEISFSDGSAVSMWQ